MTTRARKLAALIGLFVHIPGRNRKSASVSGWLRDLLNARDARDMITGEAKHSFEGGDLLAATGLEAF